MTIVFFLDQRCVKLGNSAFMQVGSDECPRKGGLEFLNGKKPSSHSSLPQERVSRGLNLTPGKKAHLSFVSIISI